MNGQQSIEGALLLDDMAERGFAEFEHHISDEQIEALIDTYAAFTLAHPDPEPATMDAILPPTSSDLAKQLDDLDRCRDIQAEWHKYRTNTDSPGKPNGYTSRSFQSKALELTRGLVISEDPKEYYHYMPSHYAQMARNHKQFDWGHVPPEVAQLDTAFRPIYQKAATLMTRVCGLIEETHPEITRHITPASLLCSPIRLLFYHPSDGEVLAGKHYDKGSFTFQIGESHQGLRVANGDLGELTPVIRDNTKAAGFPGWGLQQEFGEDSPYKKAFHDVLATDILNQGRFVPESASKVCARWSIIFFANGANLVVPDKSLMHSRSKSLAS